MVTIYFNGVPLGEARELTLTTDSCIDEEPTRVIAPYRGGEGTLTFQAHYDKKVLLTLLSGIKVTNNWLKLHGGVMSRKKYKKKR